MDYCQEDYLQLSGIQHFEFCPRQWGLIHIEKQWAENYYTADGNILHEKAHDPFFNERRNDIIISRGLPVHSPTLGLSGQCDIVEFTKSASGIQLNGKSGLWQVCPIEYKRGQPKNNDSDRVQLAAQAMCLEEMLACDIPSACLYYDQIRRREYVDISAELRKKVVANAQLMHKYTADGHTPRARKNAKCSLCSLANICLPKLSSCEPVSDYIGNHTKEND